MAGRGAVAMREVGSPRNAATGMRDEPCTPISFWRMSLASSVPFFVRSVSLPCVSSLPSFGWLVVVCGCLLLCLTSSVLPLLAGWIGWRLCSFRGLFACVLSWVEILGAVVRGRESVVLCFSGIESFSKIFKSHQGDTFHTVARGFAAGRAACVRHTRL
jgi:hypothetical protein